MDKLYIMKGLPCCGKTTFLNEIVPDKYKSCIISLENIRAMFSGIRTDVNGNLFYNERCDPKNKKFWECVRSIIETKMMSRDTIIIDGRHYNSNDLKNYLDLCKEYTYEIIVVDFIRGFENEETYKHICFERNALRMDARHVKIDSMNKMWRTINSQKIPNHIKVISPDEFKDCIYNYNFNNFDQYSKIVIFGDIHGCYNTLSRYFKDNPFNEKYLYIFCGDYIDRGIHNKETLNFLLTLYKKDNIIFLEGNHEKWLKYYVNEKITMIRSKEFINNTMEQISDINKKELTKFCNKLAPYVNFTYKNNKYVVTHGGVLDIPHNLMSSNDCIEGIGGYGDSEDVDNNFSNRKIYQIHGHRNVFNVDIHNTEFTFNLEGKIEFGGELRILEISDNFNMIKVDSSMENENINNNFSIVDDLRSTTMIKEKKLDDNVSSFNFTRNCFYSSAWDKLSVKARGLFVNTNTSNIVARSYDKFFNLNEVEETKEENLKNNLKFPVFAYQKENGYLGLLSFYNNDYFICSKSTNKSEYAINLKRILEDDYNINENNELKEFLKENNCTMIFEVIDPIFDPHIIKYEHEKVVLLDIVRNDYEPVFKNYNELKNISENFGFECKKLSFVAYNYKSLLNHFEENKDVHYEGWVIEDSNGFKFKYKSLFYRFWKSIRNKKFLINDNIIKEFYKDFQYEIDYIKNLNYDPSERFIRSDGTVLVIDFYNEIYK